MPSPRACAPAVRGTSARSQYGSDKEGLVFGYGFAPGEAGRALQSEAGADWLVSGSGPPDAFAWLHFNLANTASERWLQQHLSLPEGFYRSLHEEPGSSRIELDRLRTAVRQGEAFRSPGELLAHLMRDQADVLVQIVRESTVRVNALEDRLLASRVGSSRKDLGALRRVLVRLQRLLVPEPAALFRLLSRPPAWLGAEDVRDLRDAAEEFSAAVTDSGVLVERVKLLQEELAALIAEQNNRSLFILTLVTVLALPINTIAGLFGMNVGGVPLAAHPAGFWMVVAMVVAMVAAFTGVAGYLAFRKWVD